MTILLIIPPSKRRFHDSDISLCFGYLAPILKKEGYNVKTIYLYSASNKQIKKIITKESPKVVGIRCLTNERIGTIRLVKLIKKINKKIRIVLGGPHATVMYKQLLSNLPVDYIVIGEGEISFRNLVKAIYHKKSTLNIKGIAYKKNKRIIKTKAQKPISDLDSLPFPEYNLNKDPNETVWISSSRGCMYNCGFCTANNIWGQSYRSKSVRRVIDEIEYYVNKHGKKYFGFCDDTFTYDKERTIDICKEILKRKLNIGWSVGTRVDCVNAHILYWMSKAGCKRIDFGMESGSKIIRKNMNKIFENKDIISAFELTRKFGIRTIAYMILGYKGETIRSIIESIKVYNQIRPDTIITCPARLYPGSGLYNEAKKQGLITDDYWLNSKDAPIYTGSISLFNLLGITILVTSYFELKKGIIHYLKYLWDYIYYGAIKKKYFRENLYTLEK
ncbi:MAG: radical SAM protein [Nanoarchaeota archaeon]